MDQHTIFATLRDTLATLYPERADARLIATDAGLDSSKIAFNDRAQTNWHNILAEALNQNQLDELLQRALDDYQDYPPFAAAYEAYRHFCAGGGHIDPPTQSPATGDTITAHIGDNPYMVAVGKNIVQTSYINLPPQPLDDATLAAAQTKLATLPTTTLPPIAALPPGSTMPFSPNPLFVGRANELQQLATLLKGDNPAAPAASPTPIIINQPVATTGLGGLGKTQLATAFVHHYGQYFASVHWLTLDNPAAIATQVAACGTTMPELRRDYHTLDFESQVQHVLAAWQSPLPRLLIFDNCESPQLLNQWRPPVGGARLLVTSRRHRFDAALGVRTLPLPTLTRAQSIELLSKFPALTNTTPYTGAEQPDLAAIAAELGDLPLALHLAGSFLARYRATITPAAYLPLLRNLNSLEHRSLQSPEISPTAHDQHVARTFALSYNQLTPTDPTDQLARQLLTHAACLAPGILIPRALLLLTLTPPDEDTPTTEDPDAPFQQTDALHRLTTLGLIDTEPSGQLLLHRLLARYLHTIDPAAHTTAQHHVETTLLAEAERLNHQGLPQPLLHWQPHLRHCTDLAKNRLDATAADLCNTLGFHLHMIGDYAGARSYYARALAINEELLGANHRSTALSLNNLGALLQETGDYAGARPYLERALAINEEVLGANHPATATSLNNLGGLLDATGDYAGARPYYERALAINQERLGANHPATATSLNNLGMLLQATGDYAGARPYFERALAIREERLGANHPATATSLNNLGMLLYATGDYAGARPYYERALAIYEERLGANHPTTASSLNNLGALLRATGDYAGARPYYERALAIYGELFGANHPNTATSLNNLGGLLYATGDHAGAQPYLERALAITEKLLGANHPDTATSLNNLGYLLQATGDYTSARPYLERALAINEEVLGPNHPDTQTVRDNLAAFP